MTVSLNAHSRILIAADSTANAELVNKLLADEFSRTTLSTNPDHAVEDFQRAEPDVLVLAFKGIENAQRYCLGLYRLSGMFQSRARRTILLCDKSEVKQAYAFCRDGLFDDYVLFWPVTYDAPRLLMTVHHAVRELAALHTAQPRAMEFATQARRLTDLGTLLERYIAQEGEAVAATESAIADTQRQIGAALEGFSQRLTGGREQGVIDGWSIEHLHHEIAGLRRDTIDTALGALSHSVQPLARQASEFGVACAPHLASVRALNALAERVQATVLVVDDDPLQCKLITRALEAENYQIVVAGNGEEAFHVLHRLRPDLILLDVEMPGLSGVDVAGQIKSIDSLADIPIIMLTGNRDKEVVKQSLEAGAIDFIVKPFDRVRLAERVAHVLRSGSPPAGRK